MSIILYSTDAPHVVHAAYPDGSTLEDLDWCTVYKLSPEDTQATGVELPVGFLIDCWTYSGGIDGTWAVVPGREIAVSAEIGRTRVLPVLTLEDIIPNLSLGTSTVEVWFDVTILPVSTATSYELRYKPATSGSVFAYQTVSESGVVKVPGLQPDTVYQIALRAKCQWGTTNWTDELKKSTAVAKNIPAVRNLEVATQGNDTNFTGRDIKVDWQKLTFDSSSIANDGALLPAYPGWFRYYLVRIITPAGTVLHEERVTGGETYTYTYEENYRDTGGYPCRELDIEVSVVPNISSITSTPATIRVSNAAAAVPTGLTCSDRAGALFVGFSALTEPDVTSGGGYEIHASQTSGFTPSGHDDWEGTCINHGPETSGSYRLPLYGTWYIRVGAFDSFGTAGMVYSDQVEILLEAPVLSVQISGERVFKYLAGASTPTTTSITLAASLSSGLTTYDWEYWTGSAWTNLSGTNDGSTYVLAHNNAAWGSADTLLIRCLSGGTSGEIHIAKMRDGEQGEQGLPGADGEDGSAGIDGRSVNLTTTAQGFTYDTSGLTPNPSSATVTATALNTSDTVYYEFFKNDSSVQNTTTATYAYTPRAAYPDMPDKIEVQIREGGSTGAIKARDQLTMMGIRAGAHANTISLSNDSHTLPTTTAGVVTYTGSGTSISAWHGTTQLTVDQNSPYANSTFRVTGATGSNITVGSASGSDGATTRVYGDHSGMSANNASVTYTIVIKDEAGVETTYTRIQSLAKSVQGATGAGGADGSDGANGANGADAIVDTSMGTLASRGTATVGRWYTVTDDATIGSSSGIVKADGTTDAVGEKAGGKSLYCKTAGTWILLTGDVFAENIIGTTVTGKTIQTSASGKRVLISSSLNQIQFYGDIGGGIEVAGSIGVMSIGGWDAVAILGSITSGVDFVGVMGISNLASGVQAYSIAATALYAQSDNGRGAEAHGTTYDFYASGSGTNYGPFTGAHDALMKVEESLFIGDIVVDAGVLSKKNISNTLCEVVYSTLPKQKSALGVMVWKAFLTEKNMPTTVSDLSIGEKIELFYNYDCCGINSIGEGQINVCKEGGNIEIGDYICSSSRIGKGMKQDDDLLHNYTAAKSRESVTWDESDDSIKMIACTYHCG